MLSRAVLRCLVVAAALAGPGAAAGNDFGYSYELWETREVPRPPDGSGSGRFFDYEPVFVDMGPVPGPDFFHSLSLTGGRITGAPPYAAVFVSRTGNTFSASATSTQFRESFQHHVVGSRAKVKIFKTYVKNGSADEALKFTYSGGELRLIDGGSGDFRRSGAFMGPFAWVEFEVEVGTAAGTVWREHQYADLGREQGSAGWDFKAATTTANLPLWPWTCCGDDQVVGQATLDAPYTGVIPIADIPEIGALAAGEPFFVTHTLVAYASDRRQGESDAFAWAQDPLTPVASSEPEVTIEATNLTEVVIPPCPEPGSEGVDCLLEQGLPPPTCAAGELPSALGRQMSQVQQLANRVRQATKPGRLRKRVRSLGARLETLRRRSAKAKSVSDACLASVAAVLNAARARLDTVICSPGAGELTFDQSTYEVDESATAGPVILVTRSGGSTGSLTARVTARGSAVGGLDFEPPPVTVTFADGDVGPHTIPLPIIGDHRREEDETITITLAAPGGCATRTPGASAVVTIVDDDGVVDVSGPTTYALGGAVTGLAGQGLVLLESSSGAELAPGPGPFAFGDRLPAGWQYQVVVRAQPTNPRQLCTVSDGRGTMPAADVTNVAVSCVTVPTTGGLDPTFGDAGRVNGPVGALAAIAQDADGRIVTAGGDTLFRYDPDGMLDTSFGSAGRVAQAFGNLLGVEIVDVAIQSDGRIVAAGKGQARNATTLGTDYAAARFNADGSPDPSFNGGAVVLVDFIGAPDLATRVLVQPDGRILLIGTATTVFTASSDDASFAVVRLEADGRLDTSFGAGGRATADLSHLDFAEAAALQGDGTIVVAGKVSDDRSGDYDVGVARFHVDGSLDGGFGQGGTLRLALSPESDEANAVVVQPDGKLVLAVTHKDAGGFAFGALRLHPDGSRDQAFGNDGFAITDLGPAHDTAKAVALAPDGKIVVGGLASSAATATDFGLVRYHPDGTLDTSFGTGGVFTLDFFGSADGVADLEALPDGRILAAGTARSGLSSAVALIRVLP